MISDEEMEIFKAKMIAEHGPPPWSIWKVGYQPTEQEVDAMVTLFEVLAKLDADGAFDWVEVKDDGRGA